ncbi:ribosome modulation factor [Alcanivorax sp. HI0083]|uniref:ribosome modulation factor n=1 Tax=unclassified Alcanivorax TaxID=2638842 RepID=UPI0007B7A324|nr:MULTISPECIES: ribosome modulation factor [unclassified Alcanivorax]KZY28613.1 ribosome modulation factor [Alcanivorax sp. HI0044]KZZ24726.1 ribosome modulation factor [Alcanivorax sp. HI0083]
MSPDREQCEKAYNQGCMWGMSGGDSNRCPYTDAQLTQWWFDGWQAGIDAWHDRNLQQKNAKQA